MTWFDIIKEEWDLSYRWKLGDGIKEREGVSDLEIIKTLEYVLENFNRLKNEMNTPKSQEGWFDWVKEYDGIRNGQYMALYHKARDSDNEHIKMLFNDINEAQDEMEDTAEAIHENWFAREHQRIREDEGEGF